MKLLGDWNWYLPRSLEWLPHVGIGRGPTDSSRKQEPEPEPPPDRRTGPPATSALAPVLAAEAARTGEASS